MSNQLNQTAMDMLRARALDDAGLSEKIIKEYGDAIAKSPVAKAKDNTVNISGVIIGDSEADFYDWLGFKNYTSPEKVKNQLEKCDGEIEMRIDSPGGSIVAMASIMAALDEYDGRISGIIEGLAGSAASLIMLCADELRISEMGTVMIHRAWGIAGGNGPAIENYGQYLQKWDDKAAAKYAEKGNKDKEMFAEMMEKETWMLADEALEHGLVDKIVNMDEDEEKDGDMNAVNNTTETEGDDLNSIENTQSRALNYTKLLAKGVIQ